MSAAMPQYSSFSCDSGTDTTRGGLSASWRCVRCAERRCLRLDEKKAEDQGAAKDEASCRQDESITKEKDLRRARDRRRERPQPRRRRPKVREAVGALQLLRGELRLRRDDGQHAARGNVRKACQRPVAPLSSTAGLRVHVTPCGWLGPVTVPPLLGLPWRFALKMTASCNPEAPLFVT